MAAGEGGVVAEAAVDLDLRGEARAPRCVDLHDHLRVVGVREHGGVVAAAEHAPGLGRLVDDDGIVQVDAGEDERGQQLPLDQRDEGDRIGPRAGKGDGAHARLV